MGEIMDGIDVAFCPANHDFSGRWHQFSPGKEVLPKGWQKDESRRALHEDLIFEQDVCITLRDGAKIYADVFRPPNSDQSPVPAILHWSPYGKQKNGFNMLDRVPHRAGVPLDATSDLEKYEGLDPAEWCPRGYAIVNIDPRGVFDSDGDMFLISTQEGRDGYDSVEFIAAQGWCNDAVAFAGNSYLAIIQYFIAAEQPPHLKAFAPWEGLSDYYREMLIRGGIPNPGFVQYRNSGFCGKQQMEDLSTMIERNPYYNEYWKDKTARWDRITTPMYVLASYSSMLHTEGSIRAFLFAASQHKWLRIHDTQEWYDMYQPWVTDDLQKFFDHFLYGKDNDWPKTKPVRHSLLGYNRPNVVNRDEDSYPPQYVSHREFFLDGKSGLLTDNAPTEAASVTYQADSWDDDGVHFTHRFDSYTEMIGFSQATLYMSSTDAEDMDVYVVCRKLDKDGKALVNLNIPLKAFPKGYTADDIPNGNIVKYVGPSGRLRASHRYLAEDPTISKDQAALLQPATAWHPHDKGTEAKISRGSVVRLDIPLWPTGMIFDGGESISFEVKGHEVLLPEFPALYRNQHNLNHGRHTLHTGGEHASSITLSLA